MAEGSCGVAMAAMVSGMGVTPFGGMFHGMMYGIIP